jgi:ABC-type polysaccharide/polyol phosphate transport system ATPase subunit
MNSQTLLPAIEFKHVTKSYQVWEDRPQSIKMLLIQTMRMNWQLGKKHSFEVLNGISLQINPGEFVGIMGRNGAGKSTLLKLIGGIYTQTSGEIVTRGRIAPLLELGAGFAPELSGYENIFLNASILGYGRKEITEKLQTIIDFSELGDNLYKPVQKYSSAMRAKIRMNKTSNAGITFCHSKQTGDTGERTWRM